MMSASVCVFQFNDSRIPGARSPSLFGSGWRPMTALHFRWLPSSSAGLVVVLVVIALVPLESLGASIHQCGRLPLSVEAEVRGKCLPLQPLAGVDVKIFQYPNTDSPNLQRCTQR